METVEVLAIGTQVVIDAEIPATIRAVTIYALTFKSTAQHDADKRAGLNRFLKAALRSYGLRLIGMETREHDASRKRAGANGRNGDDAQKAARATL